MELSNHFDEEKLVKSFKISRKELGKTTDQMENIIKKNTSKEMKELEDAYKKYNDKLSKIQQSSEFVKLEKTAKEHSERVAKHLQTAIKVFDMKKTEIMSGGGSQKDKQTKVSMVYDYIVNKLFEPEEIKQFKEMRNKIIIL